MISKWFQESEFPGVLIKTQIAGPQPEFLFSVGLAGGPGGDAED